MPVLKMGLAWAGIVDKVGSGFEIGVGATWLGHTYSYGVGMAITGDRWFVSYKNEERGKAFDILEGQVYFSELVSIPTKKCLLTNGKAWGGGVSFFDIFGLSLYHSQCVGWSGDKMDGTAIGIGYMFSSGLGVSPIEAWSTRTAKRGLREHKMDN